MGTTLGAEGGTPGLNRQQPLSLGVLVLNYNTWDLALRALDAAIRLEESAVAEFVLFDDGSAMPPPAAIDPRIHVVRNEVNRGFAYALNAAIGGMKSDIVVLFDSDAYPLTPFSARVRECFEADSSLGQLGFMARREDGSPTESFVPEPTRWTLLFGQALHARVARAAVTESNLCVITACMATRRQAWSEVRGFDENFDFLDVDVDYSMRLRRSGWGVRTDPSLAAFHIGGGTPQLRRSRVLRFYKSRWYLLRKYGLIRNVRVARNVVLARLRLERMFFRLFGRMLFRSPEILEDKVLGRESLIAWCRDHYR